jgi:hypothetical protein
MSWYVDKWVNSLLNNNVVERTYCTDGSLINVKWLDEQASCADGSWSVPNGRLDERTSCADGSERKCKVVSIPLIIAFVKRRHPLNCAAVCEGYERNVYKHFGQDDQFRCERYYFSSRHWRGVEINVRLCWGNMGAHKLYQGMDKEKCSIMLQYRLYKDWMEGRDLKYI